MEKWGIIIAAFVAVFYIVHSIYNSGGIVSTQLDELHGKVDALQEKMEAIEEKLDEIEDRVNGKRYVNPIEL
jgi:outer membrane murein-binding lipoprotein Lpp